MFADVPLTTGSRYWLGMTCEGICQTTWWGDPTADVVGAVQLDNAFPYDLVWRTATFSAPYMRLLSVEPGAPAIPVPATLSLIVAGCALILRFRR